MQKQSTESITKISIVPSPEPRVGGRIATQTGSFVSKDMPLQQRPQTSTEQNKLGSLNSSKQLDSSFGLKQKTSTPSSKQGVSTPVNQFSTKQAQIQKPREFSTGDLDDYMDIGKELA